MFQFICFCVLFAVSDLGLLCCFFIDERERQSANAYRQHALIMEEHRIVENRKSDLAVRSFDEEINVTMTENLFCALLCVE